MRGAEQYSGAAIGLAVGGPFLASLVGVRAAGRAGQGTRSSAVSLMAAFAGLGFLAEDSVETIIQLDDDGIRRQIKRMIFIGFIPFLFRRRKDFWNYGEIKGCGVITAASLGTKVLRTDYCTRRRGQCFSLLMPALCLSAARRRRVGREGACGA